MTRYKEEYDVALVVLGFDRMFRDLAEGLAQKDFGFLWLLRADPTKTERSL